MDFKSSPTEAHMQPDVRATETEHWPCLFHHSQLFKIYSESLIVTNIYLPRRARGIIFPFLHLPSIPLLLSRALCPLVPASAAWEVQNLQACTACPPTEIILKKRKQSEETEVLDTQLLNFSTLGKRRWWYIVNKTHLDVCQGSVTP